MTIRLLKAGLMIGTTLSLSACSTPKTASYFSHETATTQKTAAVPAPRPSKETTASIKPLNNIRQLNQRSWEVAYRNHEHKTEAYWDEIAQKRKLRNEKRQGGQKIMLEDYVLVQPPVYNGPKRRSATPLPNKPGRMIDQSVPRTADFLAAVKKIYGFTPDQPQTEDEFMRSYAIAATRSGLTKQQLISLYVFETGGNGTHDLQAGTSKDKKDAMPISTAIGYNQLVATASISVMSEFGPAIAGELRQQARGTTGQRQRQLLQKARIVEKMTVRARTVPHQWKAQSELAKTPYGLAIHAMTLDKDVGPLLQLHKLRTSMNFLRANGITHTLTGAELEMLNLTGDGNGLDIITMPEAYRAKVPTANFFVRQGYERNPIARRNNTAAKLLQAISEKMQANIHKDGAQALYRAFQATEIVSN